MRAVGQERNAKFALLRCLLLQSVHTSSLQCVSPLERCTTATCDQACKREHSTCPALMMAACGANCGAAATRMRAIMALWLWQRALRCALHRTAHCAAQFTKPFAVKFRPSVAAGYNLYSRFLFLIFRRCHLKFLQGKTAFVCRTFASFSVLFLIVVNIGGRRAARGREQHERAVIRRCNHVTCHTPLFNTHSSHQQQL
jgi:hypothetical protein